MQVPSPNANDSRPAALAALPGTRPSCAVDPRAPLSPRASIGKEGRTSGGWGSTTIHPHSIRKFGQDRRYERDQRGRAVACA
jgi:hypothetical protein